MVSEAKCRSNSDRGGEQFLRNEEVTMEIKPQFTFKQ